MRKSVRPDDGVVDPVAIERRMRGDKTVILSYRERAELVRRWTAAGRSNLACEHITGINPRRYQTRTDSTRTR